MTTSRIVRGTKARIFLYICAVLIITGIIACYNNTLSQLEDARKSNEICHQQEENLSTQLQVISDYKQRLEKSLKTEKAEHQQAKNDLENKLNEEKTRNEKATSESNLRFNSLQQHFNMLQTQYEDFQTKLKEVQDELKEVKAAKETLNSKNLELQNKNEHLRSENMDLQKQVDQLLKDSGDGQSKINQLTKENNQLQKEVDELKRKYSAYESIQPPPQVSPEVSSSPRNAPNFSKQLKVDSNEYKIKFDDRPAAEPPQVESQKQVVAPNQNYIRTPSKSTTTSSLKVSQASLNGARPLLIPTVTPKTAKLAPPIPYMNKKVPEGVVPVPEKRDVDKKTEEEKNELPDETINNRYRNKIDGMVKEDAKKVDEADKENVAHEVFDQHIYDNFGFGEVNDPIKNAEKQNFNKQHIDQLGAEGNKLYENEDNQQIEENEPEDDDPDYAEHRGRVKDPVVRN